MLILIADAFDASLPGRLSVFGEVTTDHGRLSEANVLLIRSKTRCTKEYMDNAPNLKVIIRGGVGVDNIDTEYALSKGIVVRNTPTSSSIAVAELTMALMISVPNNLLEYSKGMKEGNWLKNLKRTELYGKTLCLLGMGNIACKVAERAHAFGMNVVAYDKYVTTHQFAKMLSSAEVAVENADYISLHLPLTNETMNLVNEDLLSHCKKKPVIINTGRALCVDAGYMVKALSGGSVSWYCADVYPTDPPQSDYPLLGCDRVTFTPHVGANSVENLGRIGQETFDIIKELIEGGIV
ncbi:MAG TPA: NAD(P)-dependent oxidoreductase [Sphaerochaeta sp.]|nr:hydroxyacid dehydrogenase [Spirochaetales bacterium]HPX29281.1 NAD(P)-dependent oxidoreductase [Sphaerochaeta sp.]HQB53905.1 NAD(P)-dependent oxidoreductase [Sphaerochaeta sp.]